MLRGEMQARQPSISEERAKVRLRQLVRKVSYHQEEEVENTEGATRARDKVGSKSIAISMS